MAERATPAAAERENNPPRAKRCMQFAPSVALIAVGMLAFLGVFFALRAQEDTFLSSRFDGLVQERTAALTGEVRVLLSEVRSMLGLHVVTGSLNASVIRGYANVTGVFPPGSPGSVNSALIHLAFAETVYHEQRDEYERTHNVTIADGARNVRASNASRYMPWAYSTYPLLDELVTGIDLFRAPLTKAVLDAAIASGNTVMSVPQQSTVSFLWLSTFVAGFYGRSNYTTPATADERNASIAGAVMAQVAYSQLLSLALQRLSPDVPVNVRLAFGDVPRDRFRVPPTVPVLAQQLPGGNSAVLQTRTQVLDIGGFPHTLLFELPASAVPKLIPRIFPSNLNSDAAFFAFWVLFVFLILALLAWWLMQQSLNRYAQVEAEVQHKTKALQAAMAIATELQVAAETANASKSKFLAYLCHELRNPLQSIVYSNDLLDDHQLSAPAFSAQVRSAASLMRLILRDVLDLTEIESGAIAFEYRPLDLRALVERELVSSKSLAADGVELRCTMAPSVPTTIIGDEARLHQLLHIFLSNSCKFTAAGAVECRAEVIDGAHTHQHRDDPASFFWKCDAASHRTSVSRTATASCELDTTDMGVELKENLLSRPPVAVQETPASVPAAVQHAAVFSADQLMPSSVTASAEANVATAIALEDVSTSPEPALRFLVISVSDSGTGMPAELLNSVYEPYKSTGLAVTRPDGTGLGLPIAYQLVTRMKGTLCIGSRQSVGTTVVITFPLETMAVQSESAVLIDTGEPPPEEHKLSSPNGSYPVVADIAGPDAVPAASSESVRDQNTAVLDPSATNSTLLVDDGVTGISSPGPRDVRVLVVEDSLVNRKLLVRVLSSLGVDGDACCDGKEAIQRVHGALDDRDVDACAMYATVPPAYDLILMDLNMPIKDGWQATRELREAGFRGVIVALTGNATEEARQRCIHCGFSGFLSKPCKKSELARLLETVRRRRAAYPSVEAVPS